MRLLELPVCAFNEGRSTFVNPDHIVSAAPVYDHVHDLFYTYVTLSTRAEVFTSLTVDEIQDALATPAERLLGM